MGNNAASYNPFSEILNELKEQRALFNLALLKIDALKKQLPEEGKYISEKEARLMFKPAISQSTFYRWTKSGLIKKYIIGGKTVFKKVQIEAAVKELHVYNKKGAT